MAKQFHGSRYVVNEPKDRFEAKFIKNPLTQCWEWMAVLNKWGYGQFKYEGKMMLAHRVAYILYKGPIPDGLLVCHDCDNPKCVNPAHFFLGTNEDNAKDRVKKNRGRKLVHPSPTAYWKGCRCTGCKKAHADYQREYKIRKANPVVSK